MRKARDGLAILRLLLGLAALVHCAAHAAVSPEGAPLRYRIEVRGPKDLAAMLKDGLQLARWQHDPGMTPELLERLLEESIVNAREAVATEGYFSARIRGAIDRSVEPWVVTLFVEPGERTRVEGVDIRFTGPVASDPEAAGALRRIRAGWQLRSGQPFRQQAWDDAKRQALRELSEWRYAAVRVADSRAEIDPQSHGARLSVEIAS